MPPKAKKPKLTTEETKSTQLSLFNFTKSKTTEVTQNKITENDHIQSENILKRKRIDSGDVFMDNSKDSDKINFLEKSIEHLTIINEIPNNDSLNDINDLIHAIPIDDTCLRAYGK